MNAKFGGVQKEFFQSLQEFELHWVPSFLCLCLPSQLRGKLGRKDETTCSSMKKLKNSNSRRFLPCEVRSFEVELILVLKLA